MYHIFITLFLLFASDNNVYSAPQKCNMNRADKCAADVFVFGHSNLTLPSSEQELTVHCK